MNKAQVIAIDGPSYVGKSTISRSLAERRGYLYINTGHMYRAVGMQALKEGIAPDNAPEIVRLAETLDFRFETGKGTCRTLVNGTDVTKLLDRQEFVFFASKISKIKPLRDILTRKQREFSQTQPIVMEGRDIGTIVFPDAMYKFFVTASLDIRAKRMHKIMPENEKAACADYRTLIPKIEELDEIDRNREIAPLRIAEDAIIYDNTDSPSEDQDAIILEYYMTHREEIIKNTELLKKNHGTTGEKKILWKASKS